MGHAHIPPRPLALHESEEEAPRKKPPQTRPSRASIAHDVPVEIPLRSGIAARAETGAVSAAKAGGAYQRIKLVQQNTAAFARKIQSSTKTMTFK
ncbi:MAG: hypothetical protein EP345_12080 [Sphingomonadales bacterium]|nr:MAG: hypothetical protein EP345_12080 [Sphingomonadales bacterium]